MATKCNGDRYGVACAVRFTCLHWLDKVLGDDIREPSTNITPAGCAGYQKMSMERFKDEHRKRQQQ